MSDSAKPPSESAELPEREWWIEISPDYDEPRARQTPQLFAGGHQIHVIEKSAYTILESSLTALRAQYAELLEESEAQHRIIKRMYGDHQK